ncbi:hypothetical protein BDV97DRAFT_366684 [Delphinella strobiligena]|nr:hypothetical protein BDV97DRAFT_366684 [Delphinella strobiligena]
MSDSGSPANHPSHRPPGRRFPVSLLEESINAFHIATAEEEDAWKSGNAPRVPRSSAVAVSASPTQPSSSPSSPSPAPRSKPSKKTNGKKKAAATPILAATSDTRNKKNHACSTRSSGSALANDDDIDMVMSAQMARELGRPSRVGGDAAASGMVRPTSTGLGTLEDTSEDSTDEAAMIAAEAKKNAKKQKRQAQKGKRVASSLNHPASGPDDEDTPMVDVQEDRNTATSARPSSLLFSLLLHAAQGRGSVGGLDGGKELDRVEEGICSLLLGLLGSSLLTLTPWQAPLSTGDGAGLSFRLDWPRGAVPYCQHSSV